ncbi:MAG: sigma-54 dependent transcriptional regulator, partial [Amphiplicatus sp.]
FEGVIVSDIRMPQIDGREFFRRALTIDAEIPVIFITGHGDIDQAVDAMRDGAHDFLPKPFAPDRLVASVARAQKARTLALEDRTLRQAMSASNGATALIGDSASMRDLREKVRQAAGADIDVLIEGETGSGKGLIAHAMHASGPRRNKPLIAVNCGAMSEATIETELHGVEAGSFQGAYRRRQGRIEAAEDGALLLDDIDLATPAIQHFLAPVIARKEVKPIGADAARPVDFRVIATSTADLGARAQEGSFRQDLFFRIGVVRLQVPALRDRREDIPALFAGFLKLAEKQYQRQAPPLSDAARRMLLEHDWPGNVRELRNFVERNVLGFDAERRENSIAAGTLPERVERFEESVIRDALRAARGDVRSAIQLLGIPRKTFYDKLVRHAIDIAAYRE